LKVKFMRLSIRDPRAHELARELAQTAGKTMTETVIRALEERLKRVRGRQEASRKQRAARLMAHGRAFAALPVLDPRSEQIRYDEVGLPR
jgi:hypothetical protein